MAVPGTNELIVRFALKSGRTARDVDTGSLDADRFIDIMEDFASGALRRLKKGMTGMDVVFDDDAGTLTGEPGAVAVRMVFELRNATVVNWMDADRALVASFSAPVYRIRRYGAMSDGSFVVESAPMTRGIGFDAYGTANRLIEQLRRAASNHEAGSTVPAPIVHLPATPRQINHASLKLRDMPGSAGTLIRRLDALTGSKISMDARLDELRAAD